MLAIAIEWSTVIAQLVTDFIKDAFDRFYGIGLLRTPAQRHLRSVQMEREQRTGCTRLLFEVSVVFNIVAKPDPTPEPRTTSTCTCTCACTYGTLVSVQPLFIDRSFWTSAQGSLIGIIRIL